MRGIEAIDTSQWNAALDERADRLRVENNRHFLFTICQQRVIIETWETEMKKRLGEYLRGLRQRKNLSTRQLAAQAGCSASFITRLESGERGTSLHRLWELVNALDGDFLYALAALCVDEGVPEEVAASVAGKEWEATNKALETRIEET